MGPSWTTYSLIKEELSPVTTSTRVTRGFNRTQNPEYPTYRPVRRGLVGMSKQLLINLFYADVYLFSFILISRTTTGPYYWQCEVICRKVWKEIRVYRFLSLHSLKMIRSRWRSKIQVLLDIKGK